MASPYSVSNRLLINSHLKGYAVWGDSSGDEDASDAMKFWEIIADNLSKAGWSWACVATVDREARTIFVADAHRDDGKRFVVRADEKLTAFVELESATRACGELA